MHALEYLKKPDSAEEVAVCVICGEEPFLRAEVLKSLIRRCLGGDGDASAVTRFSGESASLADVLDELRTVPLFERMRIVLVDGADPFVTAHRQELEVYVERPARSGMLVLLAKSWPSNTRLARAIEKTGLTIDTKAPPERELIEWLSSWSKLRARAKLDDDAARLLVALVGPEIGLLASEVEKLATYVGAHAHIRRADVAAVVGAGRVETVWQILNDATTGKPAAALTEIDRLIGSGEHPVGLLAAMTAALRKVHHAGVLRLQRKDPAEACREAGIPPFAVDTTLRQHTHLGPTRVANLPQQLLATDLDLKGNSPLTSRVVLERLLVELARPRRD
jgi:DNA polymerase-3 subunit delta